MLFAPAQFLLSLIGFSLQARYFSFDGRYGLVFLIKTLYPLICAIQLS